MITPRIKQGDPPPFYELDEFTFQDLCRDLFQHEPNIATCDVYGVRGDHQDGIDLLAYRAGSDGIEVGQCKCYRDFPPNEIKKATNEFFRHWDEHWSKENVRRFILFVASSVSNRQRQKEIRKQKQRFAEYRIEYEVWSSATIRNKLRGRQGIVATYLESYWVSRICGAPLSEMVVEERPRETIPNTALNLLSKEYNELALLVSSETESRLEEMRNTWRMGDRAHVESWLEMLRETRWDVLGPEIQAKLLCLEGSLELNTGNLERAQALAEEAHQLASVGNEARLRALIAFHEDDIDFALETLGGHLDIDSRNLTSAVLLDAGRIDEALVLLVEIERQVSPNAETYRLLALAYLIKQQMELAQLNIQKAFDLEPKWETVRYVRAMIDYFSALSPAALPRHPVAWPEPIPQTLVKRDVESIGRLDSATDTFASLAENNSHNVKERERFLIWQLASLANDPTKQDEAIALCQDVLGENPTSYPAMLWAVARNWENALRAADSNLNQQITVETLEVTEVLIIIQMHYRMGRTEDAYNLLDNAKSLFESAEALSAWRIWYIRLLVEDGQFDQARKMIDEIENENERIKATILLLGMQAEKNGDWEALSQHYRTSYEETNDPQLLLGYCETQAHQGEWSAISDVVDTLIESISTAEVVRLAAVSTYNAGRYEKCLGIIDGHSDWFEQGRLPAQLRQLRLGCLQGLGALPDAIIEAEHLFESDASAQNLNNLLRVCYFAGDLKQLAVHARRLLSLEQVSPELLISTTGLLKSEDRALAITLWRRAMEESLSDELVGPAIGLAFELGLNNTEELRGLFARLHELGQQGEAGIFAGELSQLASVVHEHREHMQYIDTAYRDGQVPIHLVAEQANISLAWFYFGQLSRNAQNQNPLFQPPLFARHGGKMIGELVAGQSEKWRLHLDMTAFLLAGYLEMLDIIEQSFAPLRIPVQLIPALLQMEDKLTPHQPARLQAFEEVLRLVDSGSIASEQLIFQKGLDDQQLVQELGEDWMALYQAAMAANGYFACFLPPRKNDLSGLPAILPEHMFSRLVNAGAIAQALWIGGVLSPTMYQNALTTLGTEGRWEEGQTVPTLGESIYCMASIAELLASAGVLQQVIKNFRIILPQRDVTRLRGEVAGYIDSENTLQRVRALRVRVTNGLNNGVYKIIPVRAVPEGDHSEEATHPYLGCIYSILTFEPTENDVIWCDDRYVNAYQHRDGAPIIGINEILKVLQDRNFISRSEYYEAVNRLRSSNVRYIPMQADEIVFHLKQARIQNGLVVETQPLKTLRRYIAACLLQGETLQHPPMPPNAANPIGEVFFMVSLSRAVGDALIALWPEENAAFDEILPRAEWILQGLFFDLANTRRMVFSDEEQNDLYLTAASYADFLSRGFQLPGDDETQGVRRLYYEWLSNRILNEKLKTNPTLTQAIAEIIKNTFAEVQQDSLDTLDTDDLRLIGQWVLQKYFKALPVQVQSEMRKDADFMTMFGLDYVVTVDFENLTFAYSAFVQAATLAINGHDAPIQTFGESTMEVTFYLLKDDTDQNGIRFIHPVTGNEVAAQNDRLALLSDSIVQRERVLTQHPYWIDVNSYESERIIADIATTEDPEQRLDKLDERIASSVAIYYQELSSKLVNQGSFTVDDLLPPSAEDLLQHHRLISDTKNDWDFHANLDKSAEDFLGTVDIADAFERLMGLPVQLPAPLIEAASVLSDNEKRSLCRAILRKAGSPIGKVHGIYLLLQLSDSIPAFKRLAKWVAMDLVGETGRAELEIFVSIVIWVNERFYAWRQIEEWSPQLRLAMAWSHAHRLFCVFRSTGASLDWLQNYFGQLVVHNGLPMELLERDVDAWTDVIHPRRLMPFRFLLQGLAYSFQGHVGLIDDELRSSFEERIVSQQFPDAFHDPKLAQNKLNSFLGQDYGESSAVLFGDAGISEISHSELHNVLVELVQEQLSQPGEAQQLNAWMRLRILLRDLPPPEELLRPVHTAMVNTDFVQAFVNDPVMGSLALHTASRLLRYYDDEELHLALEAQIMHFAATFAEDTAAGHTSSFFDKKESREETILRMIEIALNISLASPSDIATVNNFAQLLEQLFRILPEGLSVGATLVQRFYDELPIVESKEFARLYLMVRASQN